MDFFTAHHRRLTSRQGISSAIQKIMDLCTLNSSGVSSNIQDHDMPDYCSQQNPFPFLDLPGELRDKIYGYLFEPKDLVEPWTKGQNISHDQLITAPGILRSNHQLREEFLDIFFLTATVQKYATLGDIPVRHNIPNSLSPRIRKINFQQHKFVCSDWQGQCDETLAAVSKLPNLRSFAIRWHHWGKDDHQSTAFLDVWATNPLRQVPELRHIEVTLGDLVGYDFRFAVAGQQWRYTADMSINRGRRVEKEERFFLKWADDCVETKMLDEEGQQQEEKVEKKQAPAEKDTMFLRLP